MIPATTKSRREKNLDTTLHKYNKEKEDLLLVEAEGKLRC